VVGLAVLAAVSIIAPAHAQQFVQQTSTRFPVQAEYTNQSTVVDIDHDGDLDIVSGSSDGCVVWAENTAGKGKPPVLKAFQTLVAKGVYPDGSKMVGEENLSRPNYGVRVWVDDINGDGKPELIAATGPNTAPQVKVLNPITGKLVREFPGFMPSITGGLYVG
jgi:hypothetical protein